MSTNRELAARDAHRAGELADDAGTAISEGRMSDVETLLTEAFTRLMDVKDKLREGLR